MTVVLKILREDKIERAWIFASEEEATRAEIAISEYVAQHLEKESVTFFRWRDEKE